MVIFWWMHSGYWHITTVHHLIHWGEATSASVCTVMGDCISMSISIDSPSEETLNRGPLVLLLWRLYEFHFGINIVQFSFSFFHFHFHASGFPLCPSEGFFFLFPIQPVHFVFEKAHEYLQGCISIGRPQLTSCTICLLALVLAMVLEFHSA